jgi:GTP cyclohydrolase-4
MSPFAARKGEDKSLGEERQISRVGIQKIRRLMEVEGKQGPLIFLPEISVAIDFPTDNGANDHRFQGEINDAIDRAIEERNPSFDRPSVRVLRRLLRRLPRALGGEVRMEAEYIVFRKTPVSGQKTQGLYRIFASARGWNGTLRKAVGAEVMGISTCPCAQEGVTEYARRRLGDRFSDGEIEEILRSVPMASHNQRNLTRLTLEIPEEVEVKYEDLIQIVEESMSAPVYEVLKRRDEVRVVLEGHENPNFVEDIVRKVLLRVAQRHPDLPEDSLIHVWSESQETIHRHNAVAEMFLSLRELKKEVSL